jgi:hypothetical protein
LNGSGRIHCTGCAREAQFSSGDDLIKVWLAEVQADKKIF